MSDPFLSEIKITPYTFPPKGWAMCNGQFLPINQNQALFSLLGTRYGGNGQTTFALPNLQGRVPIHGPGRQGETGGEQSHTITIQELPTHNHVMNATNNNGDTDSPSVLAAFNNQYAALGNATTLNAAAISLVGGSQSHNNMQPYLVLNFVIALVGIFPSQN